MYDHIWGPVKKGFSQGATPALPVNHLNLSLKQLFNCGTVFSQDLFLEMTSKNLEFLCLFFTNSHYLILD